MKKFILIGMSLVMAASLIACGTPAKTPETEAVTEAPAEDTQAVEATSATEEADDETAREALGSVILTHELGETEISVNPEKVIVLDLGILDIFDAVGIEVGGLPQGSMPEYLATYKDERYMNAGNLKEVDFEAVNEYSPDLIVISGRLTDSYDELSKIAPTLYIQTPGADYMATMEENVQLMAQIFPDKADELTEKMEAIKSDAAALKEDAEQTELNALVLMANDGSLSVYGQGSRYGIIHDDLGFAAADDTIESSTHGMEASFEYIAEVNPDVIFVIDRSAAIGSDDATGAATLLDNDLVNGTSAAENDRIVYLSSDVWYLSNGGFTGTAQMIAEVRSALD